MEKSEILASLIDDKIVKIYLTLTNNNKEFYLRELAKVSGVPPASTFRILKRLVKLKLVDEIKMSKFRLYRLSSNSNTRFLGSIFVSKENVIDLFVSQIKRNTKIDTIIQHGEIKADKANLLIIGDKSAQIEIEPIIEAIKREKQFEISFVCLDSTQYRKMTSMGLYSGKKTELYSK
ncbi:MAG: helix-turn-helix domain-containing protein [Nanoarchaeota archaeon]|nr:helix-turn-helix domain-containing protein [Nanoarchaeota archaeon]